MDAFGLRRTALIDNIHEVALDGHSDAPRFERGADRRNDLMQANILLLHAFDTRCQGGQFAIKSCYDPFLHLVGRACEAMPECENTAEGGCNKEYKIENTEE